MIFTFKYYCVAMLNNAHNTRRNYFDFKLKGRRNYDCIAFKWRGVGYSFSVLNNNYLLHFIGCGYLLTFHNFKAMLVIQEL